MTADAKVGLLLGLLFIAIIAFLVNGLPEFLRKEHPTVADAAIKTPSGPDIVLDMTVNKVVHRLNPTKQPSTPVFQPAQTLADADTSTSTPAVVFTQTPQSRQISEPPSQPVAVPAAPIVINNRDLNSVNPQPIVVVKTQTHTVKSGEMLSTIAKTYYGDERGNKLHVIQKLFEANKKVLSTPDNVKVGDKLVIPSWEQLTGTFSEPAPSGHAQVTPSTPAPTKSKNLLDQFPDVFKKVIGKDRQSASEYVVQENDSLWSIAQKKLGNGNRYKEIARLNKIKNVDNVPYGVRLKIPNQ